MAPCFKWPHAYIARRVDCVSSGLAWIYVDECYVTYIQPIFPPEYKYTNLYLIGHKQYLMGLIFF